MLPDTQRASSRLPSAFHLVVLVWGASYTRRFLEVGLPALMSPRNLPALARVAPLHLTVYTTEEDRQAILGASVLRTREDVVLRFITDDWAGYGDKADAMRVCHRHALETAARENAAVLFLAPDTIWADGSLESVANAVLKGKRAVMQAGIRVREESALPLILSRFRPAADHSITCPPRELVRIALDHIHPYYNAWYWDAPAFSRHPANMYWRVGNEGVLARCFHLHPLMVFPERPVRDFVSTVDDDLAVLAFPRYESMYVVPDSDEVFHIDLAGDEWGRGVPTLEERPSVAYIAQWGRLAGNEFHRRFVMEKIRFHAAPLGPAWAEAEAVSDAVLRRVARAYSLASAALRLRERLWGVRREVVRERAAAARLAPDILPPAPAWCAVLAGALPARTAAAMHARRLKTFRAVLEWVFGTNVTARGLGLVLADEKRARRLERAARPGLVYALKQRLGRAHEFRQAIRDGRKRTFQERLRLLPELKQRTAKERRLDRPLPTIVELLPTAADTPMFLWLLLQIEVFEAYAPLVGRSAYARARLRRVLRSVRRQVRWAAHTTPRRTRHAAVHARKAGRKLVRHGGRRMRRLAKATGRRATRGVRHVVGRARRMRQSMARSRAVTRRFVRGWFRAGYRQLRLLPKRLTRERTY